MLEKLSQLFRGALISTSSWIQSLSGISSTGMQFRKWQTTSRIFYLEFLLGVSFATDKTRGLKILTLDSVLPHLSEKSFCLVSDSFTEQPQLSIFIHFKELWETFTSSYFVFFFSSNCLIQEAH